MAYNTIKWFPEFLKNTSKAIKQAYKNANAPMSDTLKKNIEKIDLALLVSGKGLIELDLDLTGDINDEVLNSNIDKNDEDLKEFLFQCRRIACM